jgi:two-component system OmpR family sensor kinase
MVNDAVSDARAADPGRSVVAHIAEPIAVTGDDLRLRQAVANLVRNALVHTPAGTPVEVALHAENGYADIDVIDHGPGVPPAQRERIFERFHRADPTRSRDQGGSGLGLSIATAVVGAHGGVISVTDTPGGGATFRIALPMPPDRVINV